MEDAAEAIGTRIDGRHVGTFGDIGVFSFFANKTITTGEGGMIVLNDKELFAKAMMMRSHGFTPENRYWHQIWGTNMRLTNLQAALGVAQMRRIDELVEAKKFIATCYMNSLSSIKGRALILPSALPNVNHSHWLFTIQLIDEDQVDKLQNYLQINHIESRRFFHPLHNQPAFSHFSKKSLTFPIAEQLYKTGLCLPSSTSLRHDEIKLIAHKIMEYFETNSKTLSH